MEASKLNSTKKRILCVWLPDWPVLRQTLDRGEPFEPCAGQPYRNQAIVLHETWRGSRRVAACSARARGLGIAAGMTLSEATALLGTTPSGSTRSGSTRSGKGHHLWAHDPQGDRAALERLAVWCHRYSPLVGLDDAPQPDCLLLDVTGVARFFGGEEALARRILAQFARRHIVVRIGLADTVGAAWAAARFCEGGTEEAESETPRAEDRLECRWLRRRVVDSPRPVTAPMEVASSVVVVPSEQAERFLAALPLAGLRLSEEILDLLRQLGLQRVGELEALPRADFNARFGPELLRRWDQAAGRLDEPIVALPLPQKFAADQFFEHPLGDRRTLEFVVKQLVERVAQMAAMAGRGALRVEGYFDCRTAETVSFGVGLFRPSVAADHLFGLLQMRLERLRLPDRVEAAGVRITETASLEKHQERLFDSGTAAEHDRHTAELIDRLASRLGRRAVLGVRLLAEAQPERAYRYDALVDGRRRGSKRHERRELPPRPLRLFERPRRLAAVAIVPDGPPLHFTLSGGQQRVARSWGPERIQTGWWRGRPIHRDYYRVETTAGARYWVFRRRTDGCWFLHGTWS